MIKGKGLGLAVVAEYAARVSSICNDDLPGNLFLLGALGRWTSDKERSYGGASRRVSDLG